MGELDHPGLTCAEAQEVIDNYREAAEMSVIDPTGYHRHVSLDKDGEPAVSVRKDGNCPVCEEDPDYLEVLEIITVEHVTPRVREFITGDDFWETTPGNMVLMQAAQASHLNDQCKMLGWGEEYNCGEDEVALLGWSLAEPS